MKHSIIIPHRGREKYLAACLRSIHAAYRHTGSLEGVEVVLVEPTGDGRLSVPYHWPLLRVVEMRDDMPVFNKPKLLNAGIAAANGEVLTFLDCDAIVGREFLRCVVEADWSAIHRLCYRVVYASESVLESGVNPSDRWHVYRRAYEAWGEPTHNAYREGSQPWGNSQFSIHRDRLGDLRFDEGYVGRGFEDLDMLVRMYRRWGTDYRATIETDPDRAMLHIEHGYEPEWRTPTLTALNLARFRTIHPAKETR